MNAEPKLHFDSLVIDSHNDSIVFHIRRRNRSLTGVDSSRLKERQGIVWALRGPHSGAMAEMPVQLDLDKMRRGGIDAAFFAVDVTLAWRNHLPYYLDALGFFLADLEGQDGLVIARSAADLEAARNAGRCAALLVVENSDALDGSVNILRTFHALGVRSITLTHNPTSLAAAGNAEAASGGGLTRFGVQLVTEMNRLGMLVDVSHIAERGFWHTLEVSTRPVIASHSCCAALCPHPRNLSDEQLKALASQGGVASITFVPSFLDSAWEGVPPPHAPRIERIIDHIEHAVAVAGIEHVGLGSDFDGGGTALVDSLEYPQITAGLINRGYDDDAVRKILGENTLRLLRATIG